MEYIKDIPTIYDTCEEQSLRCLVALPNDSRTYILDDYEEGWDWEAEQDTNETDIVLIDRDTLVIKRLTFDNDQRVLRDKNHLRILDDRIDDRVVRIFDEAKKDQIRVSFIRQDGLGVFDWVELRMTDRDHAIVILEAREQGTQTLCILVLTDTTQIKKLDRHRYELSGEYFVNRTTKTVPNI